MYYIVFLLDVPADLPIEEVLKIIKNEMAEDLYPYTLKRIDYSNKYKKWVAEFDKELNFDNALELDFLQRYYNNTDN